MVSVQFCIITGSTLLVENSSEFARCIVAMFLWMAQEVANYQNEPFLASSGQVACAIRTPFTHTNPVYGMMASVLPDPSVINGVYNLIPR
jgi:hypothetical protein